MKNLKPLVFISSMFLFSFTKISDNPVDNLGVSGPLNFNEKTFNLAWSDKPNDNYYIQEYLPKGETLDHFNEMLSIHYFDTNIKLKDAVKQKINELNERKKTDGVCNYLITESPDGKEFIVDFLLGESEGDAMTTVEFNVYRYKQIEISKKKKGIMIYTYSKRSYGDEITNFFKSLKNDRLTFINQMISTEIPAISIQSKE